MMLGVWAWERIPVTAHSLLVVANIIYRDFLVNGSKTELTYLMLPLHDHYVVEHHFSFFLPSRSGLHVGFYVTSNRFQRLETVAWACYRSVKGSLDFRFVITSWNLLDEVIVMNQALTLECQPIVLKAGDGSLSWYLHERIIPFTFSCKVFDMVWFVVPSRFLSPNRSSTTYSKFQIIEKDQTTEITPCRRSQVKPVFSRVWAVA